MSSSRLGLGVAVLKNNQLYAVGGSNGASPLSSVEFYDPRVGKWQRVASMLSKRKHLGVAVFNDTICAIGGRDEMSELASAEVYDPRADAWTPIVPMESRRSGVGLAVIDSKITAIGGFDGKTYLKSVECYDHHNKCWTALSNMNSRRLGGGVGVVELSSSKLIPQSTVEIPSVTHQSTLPSEITIITTERESPHIITDDQSSIESTEYSLFESLQSSQQLTPTEN